MGITSYLHISNFTKFKKSFFLFSGESSHEKLKMLVKAVFPGGLKKVKNVK